MKSRIWINRLLLLVVGCSAATPTPTATTTPIPSPTPTLPGPAVNVTRAPDPEGVVRAYLDAWKLDDYASMYAYLTAAGQGRISAEDFAARYLDVVIQAAVPAGEIDYEILSSSPHPQNASVEYRLALHSIHFGDIMRETFMHLELENGEWRVVWDDTLILPELAGGNVLRRVTVPPARGSIYDRNGELLVGFADAYSLGIVPAQINPNKEADMLTRLGQATGFPAEYIFTLYMDNPDADFYIPFTDVSAEQFDPYYDAVNSYDAVQINTFSGRYYFGTGIETGYTSAIQPEEVDFYTRQGYLWTERVPRTGLELWAEPFLAGKRGATLYLDSPEGELISVLGETPAGPSDTVYTTLDKDLQLQAQKAIFGFRGAIVVMERDTGRVLALVSSPGFNPNLFEPTNYNALWESPLNDSRQPLFNRATLGQYPLGSVFKIITMAAALESGLFTPESIYDCQYEFTELLPDGPVLYDWTYEKQDEYEPSGILTLPEGLMRSCNPWFYHIGLRLFNEGLGDTLPEMARGFGLGSPTGIAGLPEEPGWMPEVHETLDATNLATGQGELQVTPLQVAMFVAAVGNGGVLYRPQLIERIEDRTGAVIESFEPEVVGTLPVSQETLSTIQEAMTMVIRNRWGTASNVFGSFPIKLAGKTGTAEVGGGLDSHAWFAVYTDEGLADRPDIVVVVIAENAGEGSEVAAPIAQRVLNVYFFDRLGPLYPWEVRHGVPEDLIPEEEGEDGE
ncbi:MAG: penicillin-binding transpeptidase domain-containing protein [Anaerolineales bacterium]